jgi:hypothetical protein
VTLDADLRELLALLTERRVDFLVAGGHAVAFHGYPRHTDDLDLLVRPEADNAIRVIDALASFGFGGVGLTVDDFTADDRVIQLGYAPNRVDLLTRLWGVDFAAAWARRVAGRLDDVDVAFLSRIDLIANKRATARPQDLADADALESLDGGSVRPDVRTSGRPAARRRRRE